MDILTLLYFLIPLFIIIYFTKLRRLCSNESQTATDGNVHIQQYLARKQKLIETATERYLQKHSGNSSNTSKVSPSTSSKK